MQPKLLWPPSLIGKPEAIFRTVFRKKLKKFSPGKEGLPLDEFEVWRPDADPEDESGFDAFSEEFLRLLSPGETADEAEDENA